MARSRLVALLATLALTASACASTASPSPAPVATTAATSAAASASAAPATVGPPEATTLKVGVDGLPDFTNEGAYKWAADLKAQYGIDATIVDLGSTAGPFRAMVAGDVDMVIGQVEPGVSLRMQTGTDVKMIAAADTSSDYILLSTPNIGTPADLIGKKVGTQGPGSASETLTKAALKHAGVDITKINFVQIGGTSARIAALVSGQIQAGAAHAADAYDAVTKSGLKALLPMATVLPTYEYHVLWTTQKWLDAHPNLAQIAVNLFVAATRWEADNKDAYIALSNQNVTGLTADDRSRSYDLFTQVKYFAVNGGMDAASIASTVQVAQETGGLPATGVPDPSTWADPVYVNNYLAANGTR